MNRQREQRDKEPFSLVWMEEGETIRQAINRFIKQNGAPAKQVRIKGGNVKDISGGL